jgi:uncharacterized protein (TIGR04255 family)
MRNSAKRLENAVTLRTMTYVMTRSVEAADVGPLKHAPLRLALVQARTTPVLAFERPETVEQLTAALDGWELADRQSNVELAVRVGPHGVEQQQGRPETVWVLASRDEQFRAVVSASSVAVECERYSLWPDFRDAVRSVFVAVHDIATPTRCTRLGARYVNELHDDRLNGDPVAMAELVCEELIAAPLALERPVSGSAAELRVREEFGTLALRHGLIEPGRFLLDLDAYNEEAEAFDPDALLERAGRFHSRIESVFAWAITSTYLDELRGADHEQPR